jgi:transcriptional regulator with XRE-family HTH domain
MRQDRETEEADRRFVANIKANIIALVEQKGLVVSRVLDDANVNRSYLANIKPESPHSPGVTALRRIARALDEPLEVLLAEPDKRDVVSRLMRTVGTMPPDQLELLVAMALAAAQISNGTQ